MVTGIRGAKIVDIRSKRVARLAEVLAPPLEAGSVIVRTSSIESVTDWRKAARTAASARDEIGSMLGVSKQAAQRKYGRAVSAA